MIYVCTDRPYPAVQVVNAVASAVFSFGGGGQLDTLEMAKVRHMPSEWIDEAVEALPEFQGRGKDRKGRTVFRLDELEPAEGDPTPPGDPREHEPGDGDPKAEDDLPGA